MILVTGATGHFGKATINFLLKKGVLPTEIVALVRDENKAADLKAKGIEIRKADYHQKDSLVKAFEGIDKLLFISSSDISDRTVQHKNVIDAAVSAGVKHIIYTSFARKNETAGSPIAAIGSSHLETEKALRASGIPFTIMQNSLYTEMLPMFLGEKVLETGVFLPAGNGHATFTDRLDMAEAAASILVSRGHENKEYLIANNETYTLTDVASVLSELSGKEVKYLSPSLENYTETLIGAGLPAEYAGLFAGFSEAIRQGEFETVDNTLETLIGRKPTSLKESLSRIYV